MAAKKTTKTAPAVDILKGKLYAPPEGEDAEFDGYVQSMWETIEQGGNPEGLDYEYAREVLAKRLVQYGGKSYTPRDNKPKEPEPEPIPVAPLETRLKQGGTTEEPYWYEDPIQTQMIDHFIHARRAEGSTLEGGLLITGPAGSGKTMGIKRRFERLGIKYLKMDCATITDPQKWLGRREVDKDGTRFVESDFLMAVRTGQGILLDEINRLHPSLTNIVMSLLDGSRALHLSEMNITIDVHPQTVFLATANIGAQYGGTHRFDWAMRERFPYTIEREFPPEPDEVRILTTHTGIDKDAASILVDIAAQTRAKYATSDLRSPISTRTLVAAARCVSWGMTEKEALAFSALPLFDGTADGLVGEKSERAIVRGIIEGRLGRAS